MHYHTKGEDYGQSLKIVTSCNFFLVLCLEMAESVKQNLLAAFRYLLKPLVRMALRNGVSFTDFSDALKKSYVDVAAKQMMSKGSEPTEDGVALMTNIERTDVSLILSGGVVDGSYGREAQDWSPLPLLLGAWHVDPKYAGPYGVVRDLEFTSSKGGTPSFTDLARETCPNFSPQALLDELLRVGAVKPVGSGFYRAIQRSYVPAPLSVPSILYLARVVHNLCETLEVNLRAKEERAQGRMERSIYTAHGIPRSEYPHFQKYLSERGQQFADDIDNWITARDVEGAKDPMHLGVGFYHYVVNEDDENMLSKELPH